MVIESTTLHLWRHLGLCWRRFRVRSGLFEGVVAKSDLQETDGVHTAPEAPGFDAGKTRQTAVLVFMAVSSPCPKEG